MTDGDLTRRKFSGSAGLAAAARYRDTFGDGQQDTRLDWCREAAKAANLLNRCHRGTSCQRLETPRASVSCVSHQPSEHLHRVLPHLRARAREQAGNEDCVYASFAAFAGLAVQSDLANTGPRRAGPIGSML